MARKNTEDNILKDIENELDKIFEERELNKKDKTAVKKGVEAARRLASLGFFSKSELPDNDKEFNEIQNYIKALWEANYTLVRALNGGKGIDIRFYVEDGTYYTFEYLDKEFTNKILKLSKDGLIFDKKLVMTNFKNSRKHHIKKTQTADKIANALYKHTIDIRKTALLENGDSKVVVTKPRTGGIVDNGCYTVTSTTKDERFCVNNYKDWKEVKKSSNYAYRSTIQYIENGNITDYIYYRYKKPENGNFAIKYSYYRGANNDSPIFFNYGWLREHALQVALNAPDDNKQITNDMIRQVFGMAPDNVPGYRTGDVGLTQVKNINNIHLMSLNTIKELGIMFLNLDSKTLEILYSADEKYKSTRRWSELRRKIKDAYGKCSDKGLTEVIGKFEKTLT